MCDGLPFTVYVVPSILSYSALVCAECSASLGVSVHCVSYNHIGCVCIAAGLPFQQIFLSMLGICTLTGCDFNINVGSLTKHNVRVEEGPKWGKTLGSTKAMWPVRSCQIVVEDGNSSCKFSVEQGTLVRLSISQEANSEDVPIDDVCIGYLFYKHDASVGTFAIV